MASARWGCGVRRGRTTSETSFFLQTPFSLLRIGCDPATRSATSLVRSTASIPAACVIAWRCRFSGRPRRDRIALHDAKVQPTLVLADPPQVLQSDFDLGYLRTLFLCSLGQEHHREPLRHD